MIKNHDDDNVGIFSLSFMCKSVNKKNGSNTGTNQIDSSRVFHASAKLTPQTKAYFYKRLELN